MRSAPSWRSLVSRHVTARSQKLAATSCFSETRFALTELLTGRNLPVSHFFSWGSPMKTYRIIPALVAGVALFAATTPILTHGQTAPKRRPRIAVMDFDYGTVQTYSSAIFGTNVDVGKG